MLAIVLCHILQAYSNRWAFVFNVGVQAFIALSGYLYGEKLIADWKRWGVGRVKRIYVPLLLFLVVVLPFYLIFHRDVFSWKAYSVYLLNLQGIPFVTGGKMIAGIRHLWFLTAIMIAYFSTPILQCLKKKAKEVFPLLLLCIGVGYWLIPCQWMFFLSWIFLYAICYLYVNIKDTRIYDIGLIIIEIILVGIVLSNRNSITDWCETAVKTENKGYSQTCKGVGQVFFSDIYCTLFLCYRAILCGSCFIKYYDKYHIDYCNNDCFDNCLCST